MNGIKFQIQKLCQEVTQLLIKPKEQPTQHLFDLNYYSFSHKALHVSQMLLEYVELDPVVKGQHKKLVSKMKEAAKYRPEEQSDDEMEMSRKDDITDFLNERKAVVETKDRGELYRFLVQREQKEKDNENFLQNISKVKTMHYHKQKTPKMETISQEVQTQITINGQQQWAIKPPPIQEEVNPRLPTHKSIHPTAEQANLSLQGELKQPTSKKQISKKLIDRPRDGKAKKGNKKNVEDEKQQGDDLQRTNNKKNKDAVQQKSTGGVKLKVKKQVNGRNQRIEDNRHELGNRVQSQGSEVQQRGQNDTTERATLGQQNSQNNDLPLLDDINREFLQIASRHILQNDEKAKQNELQSMTKSKKQKGFRQNQQKQTIVNRQQQMGKINQIMNNETVDKISQVQKQQNATETNRKLPNNFNNNGVFLQDNTLSENVKKTGELKRISQQRQTNKQQVLKQQSEWSQRNRAKKINYPINAQKIHTIIHEQQQFNIDYDQDDRVQHWHGLESILNKTHVLEQSPQKIVEKTHGQSQMGSKGTPANGRNSANDRIAGKQNLPLIGHLPNKEKCESLLVERRRDQKNISLLNNTFHQMGNKLQRGLQISHSSHQHQQQPVDQMRNFEDRINQMLAKPALSRQQVLQNQAKIMQKIQQVHKKCNRSEDGQVLMDKKLSNQIRQCIRMMEAIHSRTCGQNCRHLERFYSIVRVFKIGGKKELKIAKYNVAGNDCS